MKGRGGSRWSLISILIVLMLHSLIFLNEEVESLSTSPSAYQESPVTIESDLDLSTSPHVSSGTGSLQDPYIIKDLRVSNLTSWCVFISNTTSHVKFVNCSIWKTGSLHTGFYISGSSNITIDGLTGGGTTDCIWIQNSNSIKVVNSTINVSSTGVLVRSSTDVEVRNCHINNGTIGVYASYIFKMIISDNWIVDQTIDGIQTYDTSILMISQNSIRKCLEAGINMMWAKRDNTIFNNTIQDNFREGLRIDDVYGDINISTNLITDNSREGIRFIDIEYGSIRVYNNDILRNNLFNIFSSSADDLKISFNRIEDSNTGGILGQGFTEGVEILFNTLANNDHYHMELQSVDDVKIRENHFSNGDRGIYLGSGSDRNEISENRFFSTFSQAIYLPYACFENTISDNYFGSIHSTAVYIDGAERTNIHGNEFYRTEIYGVAISEGKDNNIFGNEITQTGQAGIGIGGYASNNQIYNNTIDQVSGYCIYFTDFGYNNVILNNTLQGYGISAVMCYGTRGFHMISNTVDFAQYQFQILYDSTGITIADNKFNNGNYYYGPSNYFSNNFSFPEKFPRENILGGDHSFGNYWPDYHGQDIDGDGIGDTDLPHNLFDKGPLVKDPPPPDTEPPMIDVVDNELPAMTGAMFTVDYTIKDNRSNFGLEAYYSFWQYDLHGSLLSVKGPYLESYYVEEGSWWIEIEDNARYLHVNVLASDFSGNTANRTFNFTVEDMFDPFISEIEYNDPETGEWMVIEFDVHDNVAAGDAWLIVEYDDSEEWTTFEPDGSSLSEGHFVFELKIPETARSLQMRGYGEDLDGNTGHSEYLKMDIVDVIEPWLEDLTDSNPLTGERFVLDFLFDDNIGPCNIELRIFLDGNVWKNIRLGGKTPWEFDHGFVVPDSINTISYDLKLWDRTDNIATHSNSLTVLDGTSPSIEVEPDQEAMTGQRFMFSFSIHDNRGISDTFIEWGFDTGETNNGSSVGEIHDLGIVPVNASLINFSIGAVDQSGNWNIQNGTLKVVDIIKPVLFLDHDTVYTGRNIPFDPGVSDNIGVSSFNITFQSGNRLKTFPVNSDPVRFSIPEDARTVIVILNATDLAGNENSRTFYIDVIDNIAPELHSSEIILNENDVTFTMDAVDNWEISSAWIVVRNWGGSTFKVQMSIYAGKIFVATLSNSELQDAMTVSFHAMDSSGLEVSTSNQIINVDPEPQNDYSIVIISVVILVVILLAVIGVFVILRKPTEKRRDQYRP